MIRWVILDVGETLIDETRIWATWAEVLGVTPLTFAAVLGATIAAGGDHQDALRLVAGDDWHIHEPEVQQRYGGFRAADLYPDALPALAALHAAGLKVAVVANQPARRAAELRALGVSPDVLAMSDALGVAKPAPAFFAAALRLAGDPDPATVAHVGDRIDNDVVPAAAAGLRSVWLRRGPWGALQSDRSGAAWATITTLADLPALLKLRVGAARLPDQAVGARNRVAPPRGLSRG